MYRKFHALAPAIALALTTAFVIGTAGCGGPAAPEPQAATPAAAEQPADEAATTPEAADDATAEADAREQELAAKQVELELRERELAAREAAAAKPKPVAATRPAASAPAASAPAASTPVAAPPPPPVTIPEGTQLSVLLHEDYSTKTATVGQAVNATLAADLVVGDRRVAREGAALSGTVTEVVSGTNKIGAVPALKIEFTQLVVADGTTAGIRARIAQKGQSEKGRDTAKIVGGTAAGAIIGHQIDDDKGKVIGGVLGGAAGAVAAKKTGTDLDIPAGSVVPATLRQSFEYRGR